MCSSCGRARLDQAFQFIQEYTGFISPGVVVVFLFGFFWKRTSANAALWTVILSIPLSMLIKFLMPEFPWMNRMGVVFLIMSVVIVLISLLDNKGDDEKAIHLEKGLFHTGTTFNIMSLIIIGILAAIYAMYW